MRSRQFRADLLRRQQATGSEPHDHDQRQTKEHQLPIAESQQSFEKRPAGDMNIGSLQPYVHDRRRDVVKAAPELFRWRGTRRGLAHFLRLYTGLEPEIIEPSLRDIANDRNRAYRFTVRLRVGPQSELSRQLVETIIETEKPAFAACSLEWIER